MQKTIEYLEKKACFFYTKKTSSIAFEALFETQGPLLEETLANEFTHQ